MRRISGVAVAAIALGVSASNCKKKVAEESVSSKASAQVGAASAVPRKPELAPHNWPLPSGPILAILANQGVGPIRIGATVSTIERLMALPCEFKSEKVCRYAARGVEFQLENGVTRRIHVHRAGRPAGKDASGKGLEYGFFNGAIPPDLRLGMVPNAIQEHLGPPKNVEKGAAVGTADNVEIHSYDGLIVEYDRIPNGNLVMGGVLIFREPIPDAGPQPLPSGR